MGKYLKKPKTGGDGAVTKLSSSSSPISVRTRSKTLALQNSSAAFLQLRTRRLQKVLVAPPTNDSHFCSRQKLDPSSGENTLDIQTTHRSTRESTPCSSIRDSNAVCTPGSTTRQRMSSFANQNQRIHEHMQSNIPTAYEMEQFFACAEKQQQTIFMDKYNFDFVNDVPLLGRYEWVQVHHLDKALTWGSMVPTYNCNLATNQLGCLNSHQKKG